MRVINDIHDIWDGDNLLVHNNRGILPKAIMHFQKCKWHHAGKLIWIRGELYVSEALANGIGLTHISHYTSHPDKYTLLILRPKEAFTSEEIDRMFAFMIPKTGKVKYDKINLVWHQVVKFITFGKVWLGAKTDEKADRRYICGEWVGRVDNIIRDYFDNKKWMSLAPVDLFFSRHYNHYTLTIKN